MVWAREGLTVSPFAENMLKQASAYYPRAVCLKPLPAMAGIFPHIGTCPLTSPPSPSQQLVASVPACIPQCQHAYLNHLAGCSPDSGPSSMSLIPQEQRRLGRYLGLGLGLGWRLRLG